MKRIIVCCDGTWERRGRHAAEIAAPTNVAKIAGLIAPRDEQGIDQIVSLYQDEAREELPLQKREAPGLLLSHCIQESYRFIASSYLPGDEIWLFGFSRGAYTARSVIGMIRNSGLLKSEHLDKVSLAYELYRNRFPETHPDSGYATGFRESFSLTPKIRFLGAWDTVGRLGVPDSLVAGSSSHSWSFHDRCLSSIVQHAYHAVSIDERREEYAPCLWQSGADTSGEQLLFPGNHCDVGGGYHEAGLSDCTLAWMVCKARNCGLGFAPDKGCVAPDPAGVLHDCRKEWTERAPEVERRWQRAALSLCAQARQEKVEYRPANWPEQADLQKCSNRDRCASYFRCH